MRNLRPPLYFPNSFSFKKWKERKCHGTGVWLRTFEDFLFTGKTRAFLLGSEIESFTLTVAFKSHSPCYTFLEQREWWESESVSLIEKVKKLCSSLPHPQLWSLFSLFIFARTMSMEFIRLRLRESEHPLKMFVVGLGMQPSSDRSRLWFVIHMYVCKWNLLGTMKLSITLACLLGSD
jgi:hypothetical protein